MKRIALSLLALALTACPEGHSRNDAGGPTLLSTNPAAGATDVSTATALVLTFSEPMEIASVTLSLIPSASLGPASWDDAHQVLTISPQLALQPATGYLVQVHGHTPTGGALAEGTSFNFTTSTGAENIAPTLTASRPMNGALEVVLVTPLSLTFSEPMAQSSVQITTSPAVSWGLGTWSADGMTLSFAGPGVALDTATAYSVSISGTDLANNPLGPTVVSFTTARVPDVTPPTIVDSTPASGATNVTLNVKPSVTFSEPMSPGTTASLELTPDASCVATLDATGTILSCVHPVNLMLSTAYVVRVRHEAAVDLSGNAMLQDFSFRFVTGLTADTDPPTIVTMLPSDGGMGLPRTQPMGAFFSEPMDRTATQNAVAITTAPGKQVFFTWNDGGTAVLLRVDGGFAYGDQVHWVVGTGARDLTGNQLEQPGTGDFRIARLCTARVDSDEDGTFTQNTSFLAGNTYSYLGSAGGMGVGSAMAAQVGNTRKLRGLSSFDVSSRGAGCVPNGFSSNGTRLSVQYVVTQTATTGTPYGIPNTPAGAGTTDVDPVSVGPAADAGRAMFVDCNGRNCVMPVPLFTTAMAPQTRTLDVTDWARAERADGGPTARLQLRLTNDFAANRPGPDFATFAAGRPVRCRRAPRRHVRIPVSSREK